MNAFRGSFMRAPSRDDLLDELLIQVDRLWRDHADKGKVDDFIHCHPEFSAEIQEFVADLVESDDPVDAEFQNAEDGVYQWLRTRGVDEALAAAARVRRQLTPPTTQGSNADRGAAERDQVHQSSSEPWLTFLGRRLGRKKTELAASLPNVTLEFLILVSRYPHLVPNRVKGMLSRSVQERFGVPAEESLEHLLGPKVVLKRAASRRGPGGGPPESFDQLLERGALDRAATLFWRECAQGQD